MKTIKNLSASLLLLSILATTFFTSCDKQAVIEAPTADMPMELDPNGAYFMHEDGTIESIDLEALQTERTFEGRSNSGNSKLNAHYSWQLKPQAFYKSHTLQLNAVENSEGVSGTGHIWRSWGAEGEFSQHIIMDADCLFTNEQGDAVFTGIVTEVIGDSPLPGGAPFPSIGSRVWARQKDNGQGPNAPLDQYKPFMLYNPSGTIPCEILGLNAFFWNFFPYENVAKKSDYVKVH